MKESCLDSLTKKLSSQKGIVVYCAGEFASLFVQWCITQGLRRKICKCLVTKYNESIPSHILGIEVTEIEKADINKNTLVVVAVLSLNAQIEIEKHLHHVGFYNILILSREIFEEINTCLGDFSASCHDILLKQSAMLNVLYQRQDFILSKMRNTRIFLENLPRVVDTHKRSFSEFNGAFQGKSVVVCATGPSLQKYNFNDNYIHIGINSIIFDDRMAGQLQFYFNQHLPGACNACSETLKKQEIDRRQKYLAKISKLHCHVFLGQSVGDLDSISMPYALYFNHGFRKYYNYDQDEYYFDADICHSYLHGSYSVIFSALQFALYGRPDYIYIVGADGYRVNGDNYFDKEQSDYFGVNFYNSEEYVAPINQAYLRKYKELKIFAEKSYPETKIIMVNPGLFSGIFSETVTDEDGRIIIRNI